MTTDKRKVLGRGLETLLPSRQVPHAPVAAPASARFDAEKVFHIPLTELDRNPYQTRTASFDSAALNELAASIKMVGVLQPIVVRPVAGGRYQVIAGERRWAASHVAGLAAIPAIVRQVSNQQAMEMTIIENLMREDLNPMEEARAFERLSREFSLTQEQIAQRTGKDRSTITNFLRLLKLPPNVQGMLEDGQLSFGHAKVMLALDAPEDVDSLARRVILEGLSVRQTEHAVANLIEPRLRVGKQRQVDPNVKEAESVLQRALGVRVTINDRQGKGKILIEYSSLEDFDRILDILGGK
jgi:ParB family transcriptional regulator, chromosome partitioning protein